MKWYLTIAGVLCALVLVAASVAASKVTTAPIQFTDITKQAGVKFVHNSGRAGKKYLPETVGSGVAWFDADGDGWPDLLLINLDNGQIAREIRGVFQTPGQTEIASAGRRSSRGDPDDLPGDPPPPGQF